MAQPPAPWSRDDDAARASAGHPSPGRHAQQGGHPGQPYPPYPGPYGGGAQRDQPPPPAPPRRRFAALAWTALILGVIGVIGSPIIILNNLTAVVAGVGTVLGVIALFGTRRLLAGIGVALCVAGIVFTVMAQAATVAAFDREFGTLGGGPEATQDVTATECAIVDEGYGFLSAQGTVQITNSTDQTQTYSVTVSVDDATGNRLGEINSFVNSLAPGQSTTLSGLDATGLANEDAAPGAAACRIADVTRLPS